jgi:hypothetical protein
MVERQDQGLGRAVATAGFGGLGGISRARGLGLLAGLAALLDSLKAIDPARFIAESRCRST